MMAKRVPLSTVIELTTKADGKMSGPTCSVVFCTRATGFQPMGQNGLRPLASIVKEDLFFSSIAMGSSPRAHCRAIKITPARVRSVFIVLKLRCWRSG